MLERFKLFHVLFILLAMGTVSHAGQLKKAAVLLSDSIKPYYEASRGIEKRFEKEKIELKILELDNDPPEGFHSYCRTLVDDGFLYWIGVGPEALKAMWDKSFPQVALRVFSMVLSPEEIIPEGQALCGVTLSIPVEEQVQAIETHISKNIRPGLIYDPENNSGFASKAYALFARHQIELILLQVASKSDVSRIVSAGLKKVDLLWMIPDRTVISESLIPYIIKESLEQGIAVVGFNRYFLVKGAAAAFVIDYETAGTLAAEKLIQAVEHQVVNRSGPSFEFKLNHGVIDMLKKDYEKDVFH